MGSSIVRIPATGSLDVQFKQDPRQATQKNSQKGGFDFLHRVNNGEMIYLDPATHEAILASGAAAGDTVRLTKVRRGNVNFIDVELLSDATEPASAAPTPIRPPQETGRASAPVAPYGAGAAAPQLQPEEKSLPRPAAATLAGALYSAVDAVLAAEIYAREKGRALTFSEESVRAMALSIYISSARGNR